MKKSLFALLLVFLLFTLLPAAPARAAEQPFPNVADTAGILSNVDAERLNDAAGQIERQYDCGVYIVTVDDWRNFTDQSVGVCAEELYAYYQLGCGVEHDGILLLMSMEDRDYDLAAYGSFANYAFTDYGKEQIADAMLGNFRRDDWAGGFANYLDAVAHALEAARAGSPIDVPGYHGGYESRGLGSGAKVGISAASGCLIALGVCTTFKSRMKTAKERLTAEEYMTPTSPHMRVVQDQFINRTRSVRIIPHEDRSSGGGGTTVGGSGFSHHSGKF